MHTFPQSTIFTTICPSIRCFSSPPQFSFLPLSLRMCTMYHITLPLHYTRRHHTYIHISSYSTGVVVLLYCCVVVVLELFNSVLSIRLQLPIFHTHSNHKIPQSIHTNPTQNSHSSHTVHQPEPF
jgi:hypothetical protein